MKTIVIIVEMTSCFLFGSQLSLDFIERQGLGDPYTRPLSDTMPVLVPEPQSITWLSDSCFEINDSTVLLVSNYADSVAARMVKEEIIKSCAVSCSILYDTLLASNAIILRRRGDCVFQWGQIPDLAFTFFSTL